MQRALSWAVRIVGLVAVGVSAFTQPFGPTRNLVSEVLAFSVAVLTIVLWTLSERSPSMGPRVAALLPYAAAVMAVTSGLAALTTNGGPFILLGTMATVWAGDAFSLAPACAITAAGVVAVDSVGAGFAVPTWDLLGYPIILVAGLLIGRLVRGYRAQAQQSAELLVKAEQLRAEQGHVAALDERNRIAREIHDVLAHSLGALGMQVQAAQAVLADRGDIGVALDLLGQARRLATEGLNETRRAIHALRADASPLPEGLTHLSADHQQRCRVPVRFELTGAARPLSPDAGLALTRAAQEALVNTAKHAPGEPVDVSLDFDEGRTVLTVTSPLHRDCGNPGTSLLETVNGGYGLGGMRERLFLLDGSLSAGVEDGRWVVRAEVPQ
ncbi:MAG: histidine kinase [Actinomycetota bacterium]|nr:histidine kinase [Actinomycetota bacterium]